MSEYAKSWLENKIVQRGVAVVGASALLAVGYFGGRYQDSNEDRTSNGICHTEPFSSPLYPKDPTYSKGLPDAALRGIKIDVDKDQLPPGTELTIGFGSKKLPPVPVSSLEHGVALSVQGGDIQFLAYLTTGDGYAGCNKPADNVIHFPAVSGEPGSFQEYVNQGAVKP